EGLPSWVSPWCPGCLTPCCLSSQSWTSQTSSQARWMTRTSSTSSPSSRKCVHSDICIHTHTHTHTHKHTHTHTHTHNDTHTHTPTRALCLTTTHTHTHTRSHTFTHTHTQTESLTDRRKHPQGLNRRPPP